MFKSLVFLKKLRLWIKLVFSHLSLPPSPPHPPPSSKISSFIILKLCFCSPPPPLFLSEISLQQAICLQLCDCLVFPSILVLSLSYTLYCGYSMFWNLLLLSLFLFPAIWTFSSLTLVILSCSVVSILPGVLSQQKTLSFWKEIFVEYL